MVLTLGALPRSRREYRPCGARVDPEGFTVPAQTRPRARKTVHARRDSGPATVWAKAAVILSTIAAALNLGSAMIHALPTSPSPKVVVVIRVSGRAGFWPNNAAQHRSTIRIDERHPAKSEDMWTGSQHSQHCRNQKARPWAVPHLCQNGAGEGCADGHSGEAHARLDLDRS